MESQCPACIDYTATHLAPLVSSLAANIMTLAIYPFGNAEETELTDGSYNFTCQHGENECKSNMYEACAIAHYPERLVDLSPAWFQFFACMEGSTLATDRDPLPYNTSIVEECARGGGISWDVIDSCAGESPTVGKKDDGNVIMHAVATATVKAGKTFCPWVVVDGEALTEEQIDEGDDLSVIVCEAYEKKNGDVPDCCKTSTM